MKKDENPETKSTRVPKLFNGKEQSLLNIYGGGTIEQSHAKNEV